MNSSLRELSDIEYGASPKEIRAGDKTSIGIYGTSGFLGHATRSLFNGPLVVVARKGTLDNPIYVKGDCWVIDTAFAVLPKPDVEAKWLYYQLSNYDLKKLNESTGVPSISREYLYRLAFKNPGGPHQRKIVRILTAIDKAIKQTEETIWKLEKIKQGMMHDLFTRGIDVKTGKLRKSYADAPGLYKKSVLGWIPREWCDPIAFDKSFELLIDFRGKTPKKIGMNWGNGNIPGLSANNVEMGAINFSKETNYGSEDLFNAWMTNGATEKGDTVMTMEAPLGNVAQIPDNAKYILSQRVILIRPDHQILNKYFYTYLLRTDYFQKELYKNATGTTAQGIQQKKLVRILLSYPNDMKEQELIGTRIRAVDDNLCSQNIFFNKHSNIKQGLMQDLLTGKVPVVPDPQDKEYQGAN